MKYIVLLCDGMADEPSDMLKGKTPMEVAKKPYMDALAQKSEVGMVRTIEKGMPPGSDIANLSVLGYDPKIYYTGRSPLEAVSMGINLKDDDVTLRCNLVTLTDEEKYEDKTILDYCADDISTEEAKILIDYIEEKLGNKEFKFYNGVAYRHCLVWDKGNPKPGILTPPHDITGKEIKEYIPKGNNVDKLYKLMQESYTLLNNHPVNIKRVNEGKKPANSIWLWGEGTKPKLDSFYKKYNKKGSMVSAVDLLKGIAICSGMKSVDVKGATGYIDTNFKGKLEAAINELKKGQDMVYIHIEAPDECGHRGEAENKVKSLELIDKLVLKPLLEALKDFDDYGILIAPDHPTPLNIRTHTDNPVPYLIYNSKNTKNNGVTSFTEKQAESTGNYIEVGHTMMGKFLSL